MSEVISQAVTQLNAKMDGGFDGTAKFVVEGEGAIMIDENGAQAGDDLGHERQVRAGEDGEANEVDVLVDGGADDLLGREADALVDDLHAEVAGADGDLLGTVGVAVQAGLADEDADLATDLGLDGRDAGAPGTELVLQRPGRRHGGLADAGWSPVLAEDVAHGL